MIPVDGRHSVRRRRLAGAASSVLRLIQSDARREIAVRSNSGGKTQSQEALIGPNLYRRACGVVIVALLAALALASAARADSIGPIGFEAYSLGNIDGQEGWSNTKPFDAEVADVSLFPAASGYGFGTKALRISNAVISGSFGDQPFAPKLSQAADEAGPVTHFESSFEIGTAEATQQEGGAGEFASLSVSPDDGLGSRMSFLRFDDLADGVHVFFDDVTDHAFGETAEFNETDIATLAQGTAHTVRFSIDLVPGPANDVVRIFIDGSLVHTGTSWEDYYRNDPEQAGNGNVVPEIKTLIFRQGGSVNEYPGDLDRGYLLDHVSLWSAEPAPETVTVNDDTAGPGPAGSDCEHPDFTTIQSAASAVAPGSTILVCAGAYKENVSLAKSLTIRGVDDESVVYPSIDGPTCPGPSSICAGSSNVLLVQSSGVTIEHLTVDGDSPDINGSGTIEARIGIVTDHTLGPAFNNLDVNHTTVRNVYLRGIYASSGGTFSFDHDTVEHVASDPYSLAILNYAGSGSMTNNTVVDANDGIAANHSRGTTMTGNTIIDSGSGLHTDNAGDGGGSADEIAGNSVSGCKEDGYGVWVFVPYIAPSVHDNTVSGCAVGLGAFGGKFPSGSPVTPSFVHNEVDGTGATVSEGTTTGAWLDTTTFGYGETDNDVTLTANTIRNFDEGIHLGEREGADLTASGSFNRVVNNTTAIESEPGTVGDFENNWWGCNAGPGDPACGTASGPADVDPWLVLGISAEPPSIEGGEESAITADLTHNSNGALAGTQFPDGVPAAFATNYGSIAPPSDPTAAGQSSSTLTGGPGPGGAHVSTTVDNQTVTLNVHIGDSGYVVNDDTVGPGPGGADCEHPDYETIQEAVDAVPAKATILVCAGTYTEQVDIPKSLTLRGAGEGLTTISSPPIASMANNFGALVGGGSDRRPIVFAHGAPVSIRDLTVDGHGAGSCSPSFYGIAYFDAGGTISGVEVTDIRAEPLNGCQNGLGIYNLNRDHVSRTWTVTRSAVSGFQKNGITGNEAGLDATISDNVVQGAGPAPIAQNLVQIGFGAGGTVRGNTLDGAECEAASCGPDPISDEQAAGVLLYAAADGTEVLGNEISASDSGISDSSGGGVHDVAGNRLSDNRYEGIYFDSGTMQAHGNLIEGGRLGVAPVSWAGSPDSNPKLTLSGNTITGASVAGIAPLRDDSTTGDPRVVTHFNRIVGNAVGLDNAGAGTGGLGGVGSVDAEDNWWGCNEGPGEPGCDTIAEEVPGSVDSSPWLVLGLAATPSTIYKELGQSQLRADLTHDSNGSVAGSGFPDNTPVAFATDLGSVAPASDATVDGRAWSVLSAGSTLGTADVTAALDGETVHAAVEIVEPPEGPEGPEGPGRRTGR